MRIFALGTLPPHLYERFGLVRLVKSATAAVPPERLIGVQLTGMGGGGAKAMTEMRRLADFFRRLRHNTDEGWLGD